LAARKSKEVKCRSCGETCPNEREALSAFTHSHPAVCPYREDRMPSLNGVHVGDVWRNRHTKRECTVGEIRLGGRGTYTNREPVIVWTDGSIGIGGEPLWGLAEHWEPVTRPGEWPVPWIYDKRFGKGGRSASEAWRCPGMRGYRNGRKKYFHAYLRKEGEYGSTGWDWWQMDATDEEEATALEFIASGDPLLEKVGQAVLEALAA
jgi:hypothetical protein